MDITDVSRGVIPCSVGIESNGQRRKLVRTPNMPVTISGSQAQPKVLGNQEANDPREPTCVLFFKGGTGSNTSLAGFILVREVRYSHES